jgi:uncharacterized repeat protein (TIGR01451 family)
MAGSADAESASIDASVQVAAFSVQLTLSASTARVGDTVRAEATVTNLGKTRITGLVVELRVDSAGIRLKSSSSTIGKLQPGRAATVSWSLCAGQQGNYLILARATSGGVSVDSTARLLSVSGTRRSGCH